MLWFVIGIALLCTLILAVDYLNDKNIKITMKKQELEMEKRAKDIINKISFWNNT